jgi:arabinofuranan 3-O-arabinosyltransferase
MTSRWPAPTLSLLCVSSIAITSLLRAFGAFHAASDFAILAVVALGSSCLAGLLQRSPRHVSEPVASSSEPSRFDWLEYSIPASAAVVASTSWFTRGTLLAWGDFHPLGFIDPGTLLSKATPIWNVFTDGLGGRNFTIGDDLLAGASMVLHRLGFSLSVDQRLLISALFALQGTAAIFFLRTIWPEAHPISRVCGALFYCFNVLLLFNIPSPVALCAFFLLPLLAALMIRGTRSGKRIHLVLWGMSTLLLGYVAQNPALALVTLVASALIAIVTLTATGARPAVITRFLVRALGVFVLLNLWWLLPAYVSLHGSKTLSAIPVSPDSLAWTQVRNSFANILTLNTEWAWPKRIYYPYSNEYENGFIQAALYLPALLAFAALTLPDSKPRRGKQLEYSLGALAFVLIFLSKGIHAPLSGLNRWIATTIPEMWILREPASKLLPIVSLLLASLIVSTSNFSIRALLRLKNSERAKGLRWRNLTIAAATALSSVLLPVIALPIMTGGVVQDTRPILPSTHVVVPYYWHQLGNYLNAGSEGPGAVLMLPVDDFYAMPYKWPYYSADVVPTELIDRPVISGFNPAYLPAPQQTRRALSQAQNAVLRGKTSLIDWWLKALGVKFVVIRGDIDYRLLHSLGRTLPRAQALAANLRRDPHLRTVGRFGPLSVFTQRGSKESMITAWSQIGIWSRGQGSPPEVALARSGTNMGTITTHADSLDGTIADSQLSLTTQHSGPETLWLPRRPSARQPLNGNASLERYWAPPDGAPRGRFVRVRGHGISRTLNAPHRIGTVLPRAGGKLTVLRPSSVNLVRDGHFFRELGKQWSTAKDCSRTDDRPLSALGIAASILGNSKQGRFLQLNANHHAACVSENVDLEPGRSYRLAFRYRNPTDAKARVCLFLERTSDSHCLVDVSPSHSSVWRHFSVPFTSAVGKTSLFLYAFSTGSGTSRVTYDDISIQRLKPESIWKVNRARSQTTVEVTEVPSRFDNPPNGSGAKRLFLGVTPKHSHSPPRVRVDKASATSYRLTISRARRPFLLTLNQSYDPGWRLFDSHGQPLASEHFPVNGFSNGWLVSRRGRYALTVVFRPSLWVHEASIMSLPLALIFLALFGGGRLLPMRKRGMKSKPGK